MTESLSRWKEQRMIFCVRENSPAHSPLPWALPAWRPVTWSLRSPQTSHIASPPCRFWIYQLLCLREQFPYNKWMNESTNQEIPLSFIGSVFLENFDPPPAYLTGTREVNHQSQLSGWWGISPQGEHIPWEAGIWFLQGVTCRRRKTFPNFICPIILFRAPVLKDTDYKNNRWETPLTWKEWNVPSISHTDPQTPMGLYTPHALVLIL